MFSSLDKKVFKSLVTAKVNDNLISFNVKY